MHISEAKESIAVARATGIDPRLASVCAVARIFEIAVEPAQISHQFSKPGAPFSENDILLALAEIGLKARAVDVSWERLAQTPLPAIALEGAGECESGECGAAGENNPSPNPPLSGEGEKNEKTKK